MAEYTYEKLSNTIEICISNEHRFGTDAFLLADFAAPRKKDLVCDLCTGCGIIALLMKKNFNPKHIIAVDIQNQAVEQINMSVEKSNISGVEPICADLKEKEKSKDIYEWKENPRRL